MIRLSKIHKLGLLNLRVNLDLATRACRIIDAKYYKFVRLSPSEDFWSTTILRELSFLVQKKARCLRHLQFFHLDE